MGFMGLEKANPSENDRYNDIFSQNVIDVFKSEKNCDISGEKYYSDKANNSFLVNNISNNNEYYYEYYK